jgi:hypothetical protein
MMNPKPLRARIFAICRERLGETDCVLGWCLRGALAAARTVIAMAVAPEKEADWPLMEAARHQGQSVVSHA